MVVGPLLGLLVHSELGGLGAVAQLVLLHGELCVAQHVLLLGQLTLSVEDFEIEIGVAQPNNNVAFVHLSTLINDFLHDDASLFGRDLYHLNGHHVAVEAHVVIKLLVLNRSDAQSAVVHLERRSEVAHSQPYESHSQHHASSHPWPVLTWNAVFLLFDLYIHFCI